MRASLGVLCVCVLVRVDGLFEQPSSSLRVSPIPWFISIRFINMIWLFWVYQFIWVSAIKLANNIGGCA